MDQRLKDHRKNLYTLSPSQQMNSLWGGGNYSWKVQSFVEKQKKNLFCCFYEKKFMMALQKKNLNDTKVASTFDFFLSSYPNPSFKYLSRFKILDCLLDIRFSWLKVPVSSFGIYWALLNSPEEQTDGHRKIEKKEEFSNSEDKKNQQKIFSDKVSDIFYVDPFEELYLNNFIITKFIFFSKIFRFLSFF